MQTQSLSLYIYIRKVAAHTANYWCGTDALIVAQRHDTITGVVMLFQFCLMETFTGSLLCRCWTLVQLLTVCTMISYCTGCSPF